MKIAVITDHVPTQYAHSINIMKHAQGFYSLGYDADIFKRNNNRIIINEI